MSVALTDQQIQSLCSMKKSVAGGRAHIIKPREKLGHQEAEISATGDDGSLFRIVIRRSNHNPLDFSVILTYEVPNTNRSFILRRYNGKSHEHTNRIERNRFFEFHIHQATERYQQFGMNREDGFAEPTDRYGELNAALRCLVEDCDVDFPDRPPELFNEVFVQ